MQRCDGDDSFGPALGSGLDCHNFDFTIFFEDCIFSLIPSILVIVAAAYRVFLLLKRPKIINWPVGEALKHTGFVILAAFQVSLVALWSRGYGVRTLLTVPASILALVSTFALAGLSALEHNRVLRPSLIIQNYLFFTCLVDLVRVRTQWLLSDNDTVAALVTVTFILKLVILGLESREKWRFSDRAGTKVPALDRCGIFGRTLMLWLNPLFILGYRRDLTMEDLFPLEDDLDGAALTDRLAQRWSRTDKSKKHCLTQAVMITFIPEMLASWIPRAASIGFMIAQPYLVKTTLAYIMSHDTLPVSYGYGLIAAYGLNYIGIALSNLLFTFLLYRLMVKLRGSLVGLLYHDMLLIRAESRNSSSAMSLMSTDVDRITLTARWVVDIIPNLVQVGFAMFVLSTQIGAVCVAPVIVALLCGGGAARVSKMVPGRQRLWMAAIQKRVGITSDILSSMRGIKMTGLAEPITKQIQALRDFELAESRKFRKVQIVSIMMNMIPMVAMSSVTFTVFAIVAKVSGSGALGISQAFTSLSLLAMMIIPVAVLVSSFNNIAQALSCLDRIQDFLLLEKRADYRLTNSFVGLPGSSGPESDGSSPRNNDEKPGELLIDVREASFGWDKDGEKAILNDISIKILPSTLTLLVGPVASGKSTLLKSLLGETYLHSGSIWFGDTGSVAYCDEDAWILNRSIRDNIVGFSEYSEEFYSTVMKACQLEEDVAHLPNGDLSVVGSQGISLSGGQKQRVALARAVYSRKKIVIMDDTMKGLDADTSTRCFKALLSKNGLLRQNGITVIMATHNALWFQSADQLIVLEAGGRITSSGTLESLRETDTYITSLEASYSQTRHESLQNDNESKTESVETSSREIEKVASSGKVDLKGKGPTVATTKSAANTRGVSNSSLKYYVKGLASLSLLVFLSMMVFQVAFVTIQPIWLSFWTAANARNPDEDSAKWVGIYVMFSLLNVVGMFFQFSIFLLTIIPRSAKSLHLSVLKVAMSAPMSYFVATDVGEIVNRFSQDMTLVDFPLPIGFMMSAEKAVSIVGELILTSVSSGYLAAAIPLLFVVLFYIQRFYLRTSRQLRLLDLEAKSPLYSYFISSFAGLTTLRAYVWTDQSYKEHLRRLDKSQQPFYLLYCVQRWLMMVLELVVAGLCVLLLGIAVAIRDRIQPGLLGVALTSVVSFGMTLTQFLQVWTDLETSLGAITRIRQFQKDTPQELDGPDLPPANWPTHGAISISGLSAKYGTRTVLDDINIEIKPGEKVAVCGRSGSGKSTLLSLLLRMYEAASGKIAIDGIDTSRLKLNKLRESLVTLPQDPLLLAGTVRYNLDPGSSVSDEAILTALEKTGIRAVIEDKGGLDAAFNKDWLSAGQKQLFCLARAMLRPSRILLLDEATSSLDHGTDELIQTLIRKEFTGWTLVVVAHRLKTIEDFDKVLVLQDGKAVEFDSPGTLLASGGMFRSLWDMQES